MVPSVERHGGVDTSLHWTVRATRFGELLLAATERGVCCLRFGDAPAALEADLRRSFPRAAIVPARRSDAVTGWVRALEAHFADRAPLPDLPLDLRGTAFQAGVWEALRRIASGTVRTYAEVAAAVNRPRAVRAAASACANNPVAYLIPCHRVLRSDGGLGGYRWGIERKAALLAWEQASR